MKKSDAISRSVTIFAILAVLSSLTFVACGKAGDKKKAPVRAADKTVKDPAKEADKTKEAEKAKKEAADKAAAEVLTDAQLQAMKIEPKTLAKNKPVRGTFNFAPKNSNPDQMQEVGHSLTEVNCLSGLADIAEDGIQSGLTLLGKSRVLLSKSPTELAILDKFFLLARCELDRNPSQEADLIAKFGIKKLAIKLNGEHSLYANIVTEKAGASKKSVLTTIWCTDKIASAPFVANEAAINLDKGSALLVVQDSESAENQEPTEEIASTDASVTNETTTTTMPKVEEAKSKESKTELTLIECK